MAADVPRRWRWILVGVIALAGAGLAALGIRQWQELIEIGLAPPDVLHRKVPRTTVSLFLGLVMIVWVCVTGIRWARHGSHAPDRVPRGGSS
jgi:uncharacterized membrane protein YidH (DUF202 family)